MSHQQLAILHLCDSLFPLGSFAHSDGLESAVAGGRLSSADDLRAWMEAVLSVALGEMECPVVRDALTFARAADLALLARLDDEVDAMRPSAAGRDATRTMGTRLLKTWQHIRPTPLVRSAVAARSRYTFPVAFGTVCAASGVETTDALDAYCYTRLAATVSAAMRLMSLGQHEAHGLLAAVLRDVPACVARVEASDTAPLSFMPLMDIASMSHQYVHSRLFRS